MKRTRRIEVIRYTRRSFVANGEVCLENNTKDQPVGDSLLSGPGLIELALDEFAHNASGLSEDKARSTEFYEMQPSGPPIVKRNERLSLLKRLMHRLTLNSLEAISKTNVTGPVKKRKRR